MARKAKKRRYSRSAGGDVASEVRRYKKGGAKSGRGGRGGRMKSRKQAIAIGLSKARKQGKKVPKKKTSKRTTKKEEGEGVAEEALALVAHVAKFDSSSQIMLPGMKQRIEIPNAVLTGHTMVRPARLGSVITASSGTSIHCPSSRTR